MCPSFTKAPSAPAVTALLSLLVLSLVGGAGYVAWKRQQARRRHLGLARRFAHRFRAVSTELPADAYALRSPPGPMGRVAIEEGGLLVRLDQEERPAVRRVPWAEIQHVDTGGGVFRVHVSGVGDLAVPMAAGRKIWDGTLAARDRPRQPVGV